MSSLSPKKTRPKGSVSGLTRTPSMESTQSALSVVSSRTFGGGLKLDDTSSGMQYGIFLYNVAAAVIL